MDLTFSQALTPQQAKAQVVEAIYQECKKRAARVVMAEGIRQISRPDLELRMERIYREQKPEIDRKIAQENPEAWTHVCLFQDFTKTFLDGDHPGVKRRALKG